MEFDNFIYREENLPTRHAEKKLFLEDLKKKFLQEMNDNLKSKKFFNRYDPASVEAFKIEYADRKSHLIESYKYYTDESHRVKELKYRKQTEAVFDLILYKKLFNLQLQWRAEQIAIKEVEISHDFNFWQEHIHECPFIPQVTAGEVEVMKKFLGDNLYDNHDNRWLQYEYFHDLMEKNEDGDRDRMPDWYEYFDNHTGTSALLLLPDTRGEKEEYYLDLTREIENKEWKEKQKNLPPTPHYVQPPPILSAKPETMFRYARRFETDKHIVELFMCFRDQIKSYRVRDSQISEAMNTAIIMLEEAEEPIVMEGGYEWHEAIIRCGNAYLNKIIINDLDMVYDEYLMLKATGLSKGQPFAEVWKKFQDDDLRKVYIRMILRGRELAGEPRDLNF